MAEIGALSLAALEERVRRLGPGANQDQKEREQGHKRGQTSDDEIVADSVRARQKLHQRGGRYAEQRRGYSEKHQSAGHIRRHIFPIMRQAPRIRPWDARDRTLR